MAVAGLHEEISSPEAIVRALASAGVDTVFGMPGGNTMLIYDALVDHKDIRVVLVREESVGAVMAEAYGRLTGRPGVVMGQGIFVLANAGLGTLEAHLGSSPLLVLCDLSEGGAYSHHAPYQSGSGDYGSFDAKQSFQGFTKRVFVAGDPAQAVQQAQLAYKHALAGQPGPVALLFHSRALLGNVGPRTKPRIYLQGNYSTQSPRPAEEHVVERAAEAIDAASAPVIIAGNGVRIGQAFDQLLRLAEDADIPVATTTSGKGVFPETHELAVGVLGPFGLAIANEVVANSDLVLAIGTKLGPSDTANENPSLIDPARQTLIQLDVEPLNASWSLPADYLLIGDAGPTMVRLLPKLGKAGGGGKVRVAAARDSFGSFDVPESESDDVPLRPQRIIKSMHELLPDDTIYACDAGENRLFMMHYFQTKQAGTYLQPGSIGGMGYAIPAAMAAKLVHPDRCTAAVCGDGGFGMAMQGLMTCIEESIPIVVVVFNNHSLGWVLHGQGKRPIASEFAEFDHASIARAMGCAGYRVRTPGELRRALKEAPGQTVPVVIDVETSLATSFQDVRSPLAEPSSEG